MPGLKRFAPALGALGYNQRQMTGEHYGRLKEDPAAMANLTPQEANIQANLVGAGGGALDTLLPFAAGRVVGGQAFSAARGGMPGISFGCKVGGDMLMEGTTELGQTGLGQIAHSYANPDRDTSGDFSEGLNAFAGGAVGGTPFSVAGAAADSVYGRVGSGVDRVAEKAGEVVDLAKGATAKAASAGKRKLGDVVDLRKSKGEPVQADPLTEAQISQLRLSPEEADIVAQDEVGAAALLGQAAGFSPSSVRNAYEGKSAIVGHDRALQARRSALVEWFAMAAMSNDEEGKAEARDAVQRFNEKNPHRRILPMQLAQSVCQREKRIREAEDGVWLPKKRRDAADVGRFATGE